MFRFAILIVVLILGVASCKSDKQAAVNNYSSLVSKFNVEFPGRGVVDYPPFSEGDIPKSYAMVLSSELIRAKATKTPLSQIGLVSGGWLLQNVVKGVHSGWGLPVEWDAFGDGSVNSTLTIYTITTAIVIEALLNWYEFDDGAPKEKILQLVSFVLNPFVKDKINSISGLYAYSNAPNDAKYDCFNPAGYLLGQMQRFAKITGKMEYANSADKNVKIFIEHKKISLSGAWYWNYSVTENNPNDLPHATYIYLGLKEYVKRGGTLSSQIDLKKIEDHFTEFRNFWSGWHAWPFFQKMDLNPKPRLYDLGIALFAFSTAGDKRLNKYAEELYSLSSDYRGDDGLYKYRPDVDRIINEYNAYLLLGFAGYNWGRGRSIEWTN